MSAATDELKSKSFRNLAVKGTIEATKLIATVAALPVMAGMMQYMFSRKNIKEEMEQLKGSYGQALSMSPKLNADKDIAATRFQELAAIAPTVAKNPNMAVKFLEPRLKNGLSIDDVHKLTMIQANTRSSTFVRSPVAEAAGSAGLMADKVLTTFGNKAVDSFVNKRNQYNKQKEYLNKLDWEGLDMQKQSSQQPHVSEECLGEMLADRYVLLRQSGLCKEAGFSIPEMGQAVKGGGNAFLKGLGFFAPALALAGVIHGAGAVIDAHKKKTLEQEANKAYALVSKNSELIKGNPELAAQALDAIKTFAPELAVKPNILKTFIEHTIDTENMPIQTVNELATAQGNVNHSRGPGFAAGFMGATEPVMNLGKTLVDPWKASKDQGILTKRKVIS